MCLLSNRGWKYIRQDIRPHQRRVSAGQVFCLCLHFLLIFISYHCSVLKQNPERKNKVDQTKCKGKFFFLPTSTSDFLGGSTPPRQIIYGISYFLSLGFISAFITKHQTYFLDGFLEKLVASVALFWPQSFHPSRLISQGIFAVCHQLDIFQDRDYNKEESIYGVNSTLFFVQQRSQM